MLVAPDKSSITFRLHPKARFHNGDPVLAADVKYSFDSLSGKHAAPAYQTALAGVDARGRARRAHDPLRAEGSQQRHAVHRRRDAQSSRASGRPGPTAAEALRRDRHRVSDHERRRTRSPSPTRGAASSSSATPTTGRRISPVRRGFFNFDRVVYRYVQGPGGGHAKRSRPASSTSSRSTARATGSASTRGRSGTTGASRSSSSKSAPGRACSRT